MMTPFFRNGARMMCVFGAISLAATVGKAQNRDVVFQHGIWANAQAWQQEAGVLLDALLINSFIASTPSKDHCSGQAAELTSQVSSAASNAILIGHSNGGLVGRTANLPSPYNARSWGGVVTVGSPHGGAQLMASVINGPVANWLLAIGGDFGQAVDYYVNVIFPSEIATAIQAHEDVIGLTGQIVGGLASLGFGAANPVSDDMIPGSNMLANVLNTPGNLVREASAIPIRIGITSTLPSNTGLIWKGLAGASWQSGRNLQNTITSVFWTAYFAALAFQDEDNPAYQQQINAGAYLWANVAGDFEIADDDYCFLIGAWEVNHCGPSDGIVPVGAQNYPGAMQNISVTGPSHTEETHSSEINSRLQDIFDNTLQIQRRPPPGWATINGPSTMRPGNNCYWYASTNVTSPNYQWEVNGTVVGTSSDLWYSASSNFTLNLQVWNGSDGAGTSISVSVSNDNGDCALQRPSAARTTGWTVIRPTPREATAF